VRLQNLLGGNTSNLLADVSIDKRSEHHYFPRVKRLMLAVQSRCTMLARAAGTPARLMARGPDRGKMAS